jgi:hypothetical protein
MPIEDTPNFLNEKEQERPGWIDEVVLDFHKSSDKILTYKQLEEQKMLDMTRTAVGAASSYVSGHVEDNIFVNTPSPEIATPQPAPMELPHHSQLSEKQLSARLFDEFRPAQLGEKEPELFVPEPINLEGKTRQDFDLGA